MLYKVCEFGFYYRVGLIFDFDGYVSKVSLVDVIDGNYIGCVVRFVGVVNGYIVDEYIEGCKEECGIVLCFGCV